MRKMMILGLNLLLIQTVEINGPHRTEGESVGTSKAEAAGKPGQEEC